MSQNQGSETVNRTILYYPTIALPEGEWLRQALLYWDQVSSIVPMRYDMESDRNVPVIPYTPDVEFLCDENVFRPTSPDDFFKLEDRFDTQEQFFTELKRIVKSEGFQGHLPSNENRQFTASIHHNKVSDRVFEWLQKKGLAKRRNEGHEWFSFEKHTGLLYMALLAKYLSDIDANHTMPGTALKTYESLIFDSPSLKEGYACLDVRYRNVLPIPRDDVPFADILDFKQRGKHRNALLHFRSELDELHSTLSKVTARNDLNQALASFKERIELGSSELAEVLHESGIETMTGCLKTLLNVKSATLWGTAGVYAGKVSKVADIPLEWAIPGLAIVGAVEVAHHLVHRNNEKRAKLRDSNFAYVYHAQEWGIL